LVAKDGRIVYNKSFGNHTYRKKRAVTGTDIYDIASITKIVGSTAALMKLSDEGKINLDSTLNFYLPEIVAGTDYAEKSLREMLAHQAGFRSWIPFYKSTLDSGKYNPEIYSDQFSEAFCVPVAKNLYTTEAMVDTIFCKIIEAEVRPVKKYKYSDIGYYFILKIIEKVTGESIDAYLDANFYKPLGLSTMMYKPLNKFSKERIVPTERDMAFRKQLIHGYVHDQGAAMLGGVAGHAGLFSNSIDLAVMMQMFMDGGVYGGKRYISENTLKEFTACQFCDQPNNKNRRAAGFDKPVFEGDGGPACPEASLQSFGHSGFTGTLAWADPESKLVYIFLSNRVYPSSDNWKLVKNGIRTNIQQVIYQSINSGEK